MSEPNRGPRRVLKAWGKLPLWNFEQWVFRAQEFKRAWWFLWLRRDWVTIAVVETQAKAAQIVAEHNTAHHGS